MSSITEIQAKVNAANAAIAARDWETAEIELMQAKSLLASMPSGAAMGFAHQINGTAIDSLLMIVGKKQRAAALAAIGGIQFTDLVRRPERGMTCREECCG